MVYVEEAPLEKWQVQSYLTALVFGVFGALGLFFGVWWSLWYKEKQQKVSEGEKTQQKKK